MIHIRQWWTVSDIPWWISYCPQSRHFSYQMQQRWLNIQVETNHLPLKLWRSRVTQQVHSRDHQPYLPECPNWCQRSEFCRSTFANECRVEFRSDLHQTTKTYIYGGIQLLYHLKKPLWDSLNQMRLICRWMFVGREQVQDVRVFCRGRCRPKMIGIVLI